jgi:hypothetical protein
VRDLGLPLIAVIQVDPTPANGPDANADTDLNHPYDPAWARAAPDAAGNRN